MSLVEQLLRGDHQPLTPRERAIVEYACRLTNRPAAIQQSDIAALRGAGLTDREIHDAAHVTAYFAYVNRMVSGLGVELEADDTSVGQPPHESQD